MNKKLELNQWYYINDYLPTKENIGEYIILEIYRDGSVSYTKKHDYAYSFLLDTSKTIQYMLIDRHQKPIRNICSI